MALGATIQKFEITISDTDRNVYKTVETRLAQHPSESDVYLVARALALALEHREGLEMGRGLSSPDEPTMSVPNQNGGFSLWVEIGLPAADRLTRMTKRADEVAIYAHKNVDVAIPELKTASIHGADRVRVIALPPSFLTELAGTLARQNHWDVVRSGGKVYLTANGTSLEMDVVELNITR